MTLKKLTLAQIEVGSTLIAQSGDNIQPSEIVAVYLADTSSLIRAKTDSSALDAYRSQAIEMDPDEAADIVSFFIRSVLNFTERCTPKLETAPPQKAKK